MADGPPRFRPRVVLGSLLMLASGFLSWWRVGGESVNGVQIPTSEGLGLEGSGIVVYAAALCALLALDVGYLRGRRGFVLDRPSVYLALGLAGAGAVAIRAWQLWSVAYVPLPANSPGMAVAAAGVGLVLYGAGLGLTPRRGC